MESAVGSSDLYEPLVENLKRLDEYRRSNANLRGHEDEAVRTFRAALRGRELNLTATALTYLATTSTEFTVALIDDLLYMAGSDRYTIAVAELLGRLSYEDLRKLVPAAVERALEVDDVDYGDWFRMADVLNYLGLYEALRALVDKARDHIDGDVRELADSYGDV